VRAVAAQVLFEKPFSGCYAAQKQQHQYHLRMALTRTLDLLFMPQPRALLSRCPFLIGNHHAARFLVEQERYLAEFIQLRSPAKLLLRGGKAISIRAESAR
jgi:hypothetical protein